MINIFQPALKTEELEAVKRVFDSNWIGRGKLTDQFEHEFASYVGVDRTLIRSISCCSEGLFQAMELLGIGTGDEVILPSISFVAAANAIASKGAIPVFCDVAPRSLNTTAQLIDEKITPRTKAAIILHYGGVPCEMDDILTLLNNRNIALVEDNACGVASQYKGKACGTLGDIGVWSFDAMKILVAGDGGMIYCHTPELSQKAEESIYLGLKSKSGFSNVMAQKWWEFEISCYGRRAIMNDLLSAIGREQLKKLPAFIARRKAVHDYYNVALADVTWLKLPPPIPANVESSYYFYWIQMPLRLRDRLAHYLREAGIYTTFRYYPLHWVKFYDSPSSLPFAEEAAQTTLCIPLHHSLSSQNLELIVDRIHAFSRSL